MMNAVLRRTRTREKTSRHALPLRTWNRRLHFYLGLYFLLFIWLFSISGLLLNHSSWISAISWERRVESTFERVITAPPVGEDVAVARDLMAQLDIVGEINSIDRQAEDGRLRMQVVRPGQVFNIDASPQGGVATVDQIDLNTWGVLDALHKFTGVSITDPTRERDWVMTRIWSIAMDALAIGLIVLVLSGLYLWFRLPTKRTPGLLFLSLGTLTCAIFLFGVIRLL